MSAPPSRIAVVIPFAGQPELLHDCLESVMPQARALEAAVIVVDDGSRNEDAAELACLAGATVVRRDERGGPYVARNDGWRSTDAGVIAFTDVRARPRPDWLAELVKSLDSDGVAIVGGDSVVVGGTGRGAQYLRWLQPYSVSGYVADPFLPYLPTVNLATTRTVLEELGGFAITRSGGDADLCWRAQLAGLGEIRVVPQAIVEVLPRSSLTSVVRQWWRYGLANPALARAFAKEGHPGGSLRRALHWMAIALRDGLVAMRHRRAEAPQLAAHVLVVTAHALATAIGALRIRLSSATHGPGRA